MTQERTWVRIAGNAKLIKAGGEEGWRCFLGTSRDGLSSNGEVPLREWTLSGEAIPGENFIPGFHNFKSSSEEPVVVAWIDMFGDVAIENGTAHITLLPR